MTNPVDWLENNPESPYRMNIWEGDINKHVWATGGPIATSPMITLKDDDEADPWRWMPDNDDPWEEIP